jgi:hypothetical protein
MNTLVWIVVAVLFVFLLTYDPKTKTLDKYIKDQPPVPKASQQKPEEPVSKCPADRYYQVQFGGNAPAGVCKGTDKSFMGAII